MRPPANPRRVQAARTRKPCVTKAIRGDSLIGSRLSTRVSRNRSCGRREKAHVDAVERRTQPSTAKVTSAKASDTLRDAGAAVGGRSARNTVAATESHPVGEGEDTANGTNGGPRQRPGTIDFPLMVTRDSDIPEAGGGMRWSGEYENKHRKREGNPNELPPWTIVARMMRYKRVCWDKCLSCIPDEDWKHEHDEKLKDMMTAVVHPSVVYAQGKTQKEQDEEIRAYVEEVLSKKRFMRELVKGTFCCAACDKRIPENKRLPLEYSVTIPHPRSNAEQTWSMVEVMDTFSRNDKDEVTWGPRPNINRRNALWRSANEASKEALELGIEPNAVMVEEQKSRESKTDPRVASMLIVTTQTIQKNQEIVVQTYGPVYDRKNKYLNLPPWWAMCMDNQIVEFRDGKFGPINTIANKPCGYQKEAKQRLQQIIQQECDTRNIAPAPGNISTSASEIAQAAHSVITQP